MVRRLILIGFVALMIAPLPAFDSSTAQGGWQVESPVPLSEQLDDFFPIPQRVVIAPDGRQVVYETQGESDTAQLCVLDLVAQQERCIGLPREYGFSNMSILPPLRWSPDATRIATVGTPLIVLRDTDLGLVDLTELDLTFANLMDDDYVGNLLFGSDPLPSDLTVPSYPAFSPDNAQIAIEKTGVGADGELASSWISIVDVATGAIRDLTRLPGHEIYERDMGTIVAMDWSPDGTSLAFSLLHSRMEPAYDGLWLLDIETLELQRLVTMADAKDLVDAIFGEADGFLAIAPVLWSPDGARLLFWAGALGAYIQREWVFWIEMASSEITTVPLPTTPADQPGSRSIWPRQAVWSPDGAQLLVAARVGSFTGEPMPLTDSDDEMRTALYLIDVASGEITLLGHLPLELAGPYAAAWGADNHVIAGGYTFRLIGE